MKSFSLVKFQIPKTKFQNLDSKFQNPKPLLINDFYTCQDSQVGEQEISCRIVFNGEHAIFKGHFPRNPVVPGVCMMEMVKELLQEQVHESLMLRSTGNVKFLQLITPDVQPVIKIEWKQNEAGYAVKASINLAATAMFKFDGNFVNS